MKTILSLIAAVLLIVGAFISPAFAVVSFDDVEMDHYFADDVIFLHAEGIVNGYPDGTFRPHDEITRAHAVAMLGRALKLDDTQRATDFSDVAASNPFSGYIDAATELGIIRGYPDGTFRPNEKISRAHVALILERALDFPDVFQEPFSDVVPSMEAYEAIAQLANFGVAQGFPDGTFGPNLKVTRGQFAAFLARSIEPSFIPGKQELLETANDILVYLENENFDAVEDYVDDEGLTFCPFAGGCIDDGGVTMTEEEVEDFMDNTTTYLWGYEAGSGFEINLTPAGYYDKYLMNASYEEKEMYGREGHPSTRELVRKAFPEGTVVEFYYPGTEEYGYMDWQSLNMVFEEEQNGEWTLIALVNDRWTP
ncbi:S-layer homology domain-containing protein [Planococcus lenghuensis]|uniref:S-layer protein n=1 Tax=Planococcus lenghuensis TaxID=2213202 RepID=A0A1Q2KUY7_9BACL|nr:S-layer homology domain-containing protein [Planococcus lenghuensis]AQQ51999.1 S-layer protein [Planococcus lenghuensis]